MIHPAEPWEWPFVAATIGPAVDADGVPSLEEVREQIGKGTMQAWRISGGAVGYAITQTAYVRSPEGWDTDTIALWVVYVAGKTFRTPRATMRRVWTEFEAKAREWRCKEMRIEGKRVKQWALVADFEPVSETILRKAL